MDYRNASDEQLVRMIGGGAMPGSMAFEGCQAELNRRLAENWLVLQLKPYGYQAFLPLLHSVPQSHQYFSY
ncbi:MAG: hypothetical protein MK088_17985 [Alteromonas sp.]|nr:hypothetical protein [Alteromonas sp.]NKX05686.1 hypothetical protein [Alteromonadaceae bacterium A_SAG6]NKX19586.1 hypothetical protein [Alteromonadaceae bacterium A_SAG8]NKX36011.1 hypothetical protein [Alteromonadaceae bacterium A_SAG3]NKX69856.1 hypothetical protein [Alteromonadaceae bacterium A_SAG7]